MILGVGNKHIAIQIDAQMLGSVQSGLPGVSVVACCSRLAGAGDGADAAAGIDDAQGMAASLQDIDVAVRVRGDGARIDEWSRGCLGSVGRYAALAIAGDR